MITISEYAAVLGQLQEIVHEQTAGLNDDELLIQPPSWRELHGMGARALS